MAESKIYTLHDPISPLDQRFTELTFKPPTGRILMKVGNPFDFLNGQIKVDDAKAGAMIGELTGIGRPGVEELSITDWVGCILVLQGFLETPGEIRSSIGISNAPASGGTT